MACCESIAATLEEYRRSYLLLQGRLLQINRQLGGAGQESPQLMKRRALLYIEMEELAEQIREMTGYLAQVGCPPG